jgi:LysR family hydrogen peroxide-inducible transcriptional activator
VISQLLREGDLDAVILALPLDEENMVEHRLYAEPFYLTVSRQHPKAGRKSVTVDDLEEEQVLLLEDGHCLRDQALAVCNSHNAVENTNFRATSLIPFRGEIPHRDIGLCWRKSSTREPLLAELTELLVDTLS